MKQIHIGFLSAVIALGGSCKTRQNRASEPGDDLNSRSTVSTPTDPASPGGQANGGDKPKTDPADAVEAANGELVGSFGMLASYPARLEFKMISPPLSSGKSMTLGFDTEKKEKFDILLVYSLRVRPDFSKNPMPKEAAAAEGLHAFMEAWIADLNKDTAAKDILRNSLKGFQWNKDADKFLSKVQESVPPLYLAGKPDFEKKISNFISYRVTAKLQGATQLSGKLGKITVNFPVQINPYKASQVVAGETRYLQTNKDGCVNCHGDIKKSVAYLKHSSDFLVTFTDAQLLEVVKNARFPNGKPVNKGNHKFIFTSTAQEKNMIAYLRGLPPSFERIPR